MSWTCRTWLSNECQNVWMRIRNVIKFWLHKQFLSTSERTQHVSCLHLWQWMKHGYICMIQRQKNNLRGADTEVQLIQKSFEKFFGSQPPRWWHLVSGTKMGYCWLNISKRVQWQWATTHFTWTKWRRHWSPNGRGIHQKECCFSRTMPPHTVPITQRKLADLHCEVLKHAASSSDLAHSE